MDEISEIDDCLVTAEEIRNFLMPIVGSYFKTDEDLVVLESMQTDPPKNHYINEVNRNKILTILNKIITIKSKLILVDRGKNF